jgi:CheY-like chemotaxis protein
MSSRILLADDSPHAQRMGEQILSEEGYEVVTVSDGDSALIRLDDVDPDVVLADAIMPKRSGYEVCQFIKMSPRHRRTRVLVTIGAMESLDDEMVSRAQPDGVLKKPFEASVLLETIKPLAAAAAAERPDSTLAPATRGTTAPGIVARAIVAQDQPIVAVIDPELVRAAVTIALDAAMPAMIDEITDKVLVAVRTKIS